MDERKTLKVKDMTLKNAKAALLGKTLHYYFAATKRETTIKVAHVRGCGGGSVNCSADHAGLDIFIPGDVLGELVQFGEFKNSLEVDGQDVSEAWTLTE